MSEPIDLGDCDGCGQRLGEGGVVTHGKRYCISCAIPIVAEHGNLPPEELAAMRAINDYYEDRQN